ncbi:MAG: transcription termination/antitermination protein NusA [Anaerolineae bacterium]|nr:transcription termination/antitermination protein NusA [Anaerolineae bacterium]
MKSDFNLAFNEIVEMRALSPEIVREALSLALVSAYRRDANIGSNQNVEASIDLAGQSEIRLEKEVVETVQTDQTEVTLDEARLYHPKAEIGDLVMVPVKTGASFGRIAAQTAKQVILQRIREAERESLYDEFVEREGDLITGTVQSVTSGAITISLGRAEAVMPRKEQIPGERYRPHDKVRAYLAEVRKNSRGPQIIVSRAHKSMLRRLLEYEVPEIYNGQVEIKNIAREAGHRSKVAVAALQEGVDPVGACVGMRGIRIQNIVKELNDEKIDVIEWSVEPAVFIAKALSPARVSDMLLEEDIDTGRTATVIVPDDQLSLAIGREGQNARLAAKLTGWRIDIKSVSESALEAFAVMDEPPLSELKAKQPDLIAEIERIMEKRQANRPIQPEEFRTITDFVKMAERRLLDVRDAARAKRQTAMNTVRSLVPDVAFNMAIKELELDDDINNALTRIDNVGDLMIRLLADEDALELMLKQGGAGDDAMDAIRYALDDLVILRPPGLEPVVGAAPEPEPEPVAAIEPEPEPEPVFEVAAEVEFVDLDEEVLPAIIEPEPEPEPVAEVEPEPILPVAAAPVVPRPRPVDADDELFDGEEGDDEERRRKKSKVKRRQLVFDEERGEVVAKRQRKGSRRRESWEDMID